MSDLISNDLSININWGTVLLFELVMTLITRLELQLLPQQRISSLLDG